MGYRLLADAVVLFHFLWILFIIFGGVWGRRKLNKVIYLDVPHAPVVAATVLICLWNFWLYRSAWKGRKD